jgi:ABC-type transporter Mla MlaB component
VFHIEGEVCADHLEKLSTYLFDALNSSDHLIVNIEKINKYDCSFVMLICSVRKTARLLNKPLTIQGRSLENSSCEHEDSVQWTDRKCKFAGTPHCYLWESILKTIPKFA